MGVFGGFVYGTGVVYGGSETVPQIAEIETVHKDKIRITFNTTVVVNSVLTTISGYSISLDNGIGLAIALRSVVTPNSLVVSEIYIITDPQTPGAIYRVTIPTLQETDGTTFTGSAKFEARRTKASNILAVLPSYLDKSPTSVPRIVLEALASEDERIGGSRRNRL